MSGDETGLTCDDGEAPESAPVTATGDRKRRRRLGRFVTKLTRRPRGKVLPAVMALMVVVSVGLAAGLTYYQYRPDQATDAEAAKSAIAAASDGAVAVLSYSPDTLDRDFSSAKSHLTGDFLAYYSQFTRDFVAPAAKQKSVRTTATVLRAAVAELHPDSAAVLLFVNQSMTSKDKPEPTSTASSVLVKLTKSHGTWLISSFDPI